MRAISDDGIAAVAALLRKNKQENAALSADLRALCVPSSRLAVAVSEIIFVRENDL